jgi:O-phospho-L-seryl-tRNASec:L-selenocysteinyl-tRNA synthase
VNEMIRSRHFGFAHGIGRSGDVAAVQPKAAGSSVIVKVTACLVKDLIRRVCGIHRLNGVLVLPVATGE